MRILILNGSARAHGNTSTLTAAFKRGAEEAGNDVVELPVGRMAIRGCLGCEYCHGRGHGECIIRDDEKEVKEEMKKADMLVLASPIYFFSPSAQLEAAIQRMHAKGIPDNIRESAMILTSGSPGVYDAAKAQYKAIFDYLGTRDRGIFTAWQRKQIRKKTEGTRRLRALPRFIKEEIHDIKRNIYIERQSDHPEIWPWHMAHR